MMIIKLVFKIFDHFYSTKMSQTYQSSASLKKQFRIGNCNFSLQACRWKSTYFKQKARNDDNTLLHKKNTFPIIPNIRLNKTSVLLSDHIYMFGGIVKGLEKQNFCAINLKNNRWHDLVSQSNPQRRDSHGLTVLRKEIYLFGGSNKTEYFNDIHSFNNFTNQWRCIQNKGTAIPEPRDPMAFLSIKNQYLLLIGGINLLQKQYFEDLFIWKNKQWKNIETNYPSNLISAKVVEVNGKIFLFGGVNRVSGEYNSTLYEIAIDEEKLNAMFNPVKLNIQVFPQGRIDHQLVTINSQYFLLIGGNRINQKIYKDIWVFDLLSYSWARIEPKNGPLRGIHSFSAVMYNNIVYLIGGFLQNRREINDQVLTIQFANEEIFKSEVCENCVSLLQKKENEMKKFPKDLMLSVGFLYNMALQIKFPFHAIAMIYEASKYFGATFFRIFSQKTVNNFNYLRIEFNGCSFGRSQFLSFISHNGLSPQLKSVTENIKLGAFRLGKTFLLVSSDKKFRYVYLLSAQSRVSPHYDQTYVYYSYIQNIELQRIETEEGIKQRQLILNIIKTHISKPEVLLSTPQKSIILIFENKVVMSAERDYICQLVGEQYDIKVWKNDKKTQFLQQRGYNIQEDIQISLRNWMSLYYFKPSPNETQFYFSQDDEPVKFTRYKDLLDILCLKGIISKIELPSVQGIELSGEIYITTHPHFIQNNYGLLIYSKGHLYARYDIDFGRLFPQHFYKSKYKQARTIFYQMGYINIENGLEQNYFKNGFTRRQKYISLLQKIQQKCDDKRKVLMDLQNDEIDHKDSESQNSKPTKKVKI